jgi:hypothetical protein
VIVLLLAIFHAHLYVNQSASGTTSGPPEAGFNGRHELLIRVLKIEAGNCAQAESGFSKVLYTM